MQAEPGPELLGCSPCLTAAAGNQLSNSAPDAWATMPHGASHEVYGAPGMLT